MQTYVVEYKHTPWSEHGGFKNTPDYYDLERVVIRSQDIDHQ